MSEKWTHFYKSSKSIELAGKNVKQQGKNGIGLFNSTLMALQSKHGYLDIRE